MFSAPPALVGATSSGTQATGAPFSCRTVYHVAKRGGRAGDLSCDNQIEKAGAGDLEHFHFLGSELLNTLFALYLSMVPTTRSLDASPVIASLPLSSALSRSS